MQRLLIRTTALTLWLTLALGLASSPALAQYKLTNLTSNQAGKAKNQDPLLQNAWGLVYGPGTPFWVSDEWNGWSTLYNGAGVPQSLQVVVPSASGSGPGSPTGIVYNGSSEFQIDSWPSEFMYGTLDGTIQGWSHFDPSTTLIGVNNSANKVSYTGLAVTSHSSGNFVYAADFNNNKIDMYDGTFKFVQSFTDTTIPKGFVVFNVQDIGGQLYVAYASATGGAGGYIDIFTEAGAFVKRFAHGKPLNQPWGFAVAPKNFGPLSNTLLISNNTNTGTINGFNLTTGKFVGTIKNSAGKAIAINQLWGIDFGGGALKNVNGKTNQLFFTAGPGNNVDGLFGVIAFK
ncbi:MAG TPA: TIGR03118 family protein [Terriglobales bacterium]|nr:TIGR03118 family protein [Terriglobales bacterium]